MIVLDVPYYQQETEDTCAPACLRMALAFRFPEPRFLWSVLAWQFSRKPSTEVELAKQCACLVGQGTRPEDVFHAARRYRLAASWLDNSNLAAEVEGALQAGCPVLANVELRALPYVVSPPPGRVFWHTVLIVGMDDRYIYVHDPDPAHGGPRRAIERSHFLAGWDRHGHSAHRV
jgi:hypothetical protein